MSNGDELNDLLEFEQNINALKLEDRVTFVAKQSYTLTAKVDVLREKVDNLSGKVDSFSEVGITKKTVATTGGITAAIIIGIVEGLKTLFGR